MLSYQKVSDKPQIGWVSTNIVEDRLDVDFFNPEYVESNIILIESGLPIVELGKLAQLFTGPFGSRLPSSLYRSFGVPLLRVKNIGEFQIDTNDLVYLDKATHKELSNSRLSVGDLALAKSGSFGNIVPIWSKYGECNITEHILGIHITDNEIDRVFLAVFLSSRYGMSQVKQKANGTLIKYLGVETSRSIKVPITAPEIQTYIGDKVRLAERCRETASSYRQEMATLLRKHSGLSTIEEAFARHQKQLSHFVEPTIVDNRIDAEFYRPNHLDVDETIRATPWLYLKGIIHLPVKGIQPVYDQAGTVPAITVTHIDPNEIDINSAQRVTKEWMESKSRATAQPDEVLITVTGPPLGEAAVVHKHHYPLVINSHVARIKLRAKFPYPNYLAAVLNSAIGSIQVYRHCKGVRQKELYPDQIHQFVIPEIDIDIVKQIDRLGKQADLLDYQSVRLIAEAKTDVEKLIEGKLDTEGIIAGRLKAPTLEDIQAE